jgi:hypothetical protein
MVFDKNYYEFFMKNKKKFDQYEVIALQRVIKHYDNALELIKICENYKYDFKLSNNIRYEVKAEPYSLISKIFMLNTLITLIKNPLEYQLLSRNIIYLLIL